MDTKKVAITLLVITIALTAFSLAADLGGSDAGTQTQGNTDSGAQANVGFTVEAPNDSENDSQPQRSGGGQ